MNRERIYEKERLYIPKGAKEKTYYWSGFGKDELKFISSFIPILIGFTITVHIFLNSQIYTILTFLSGMSFLIIFSSKDDNNQCVFDYIKYIFLFHYSKKNYEYVQLNEYEIQEE